MFLINNESLQKFLWVCENQNVAAHTGGSAVISKETLYMLANREDQSARSLCNSIHSVHYVKETWKIISYISKVSLFWKDLENNNDVSHVLTFIVACPVNTQGRMNI